MYYDLPQNVHMPRRLISVRVDECLLAEVRRQTGARSESEAIRMALEIARELGVTQRFLRKWGGKGGPDAFTAR